MPNIYLSNAELKALQDVFDTAEDVDWDAYERARALIRQAHRDSLDADRPRPQPAKAGLKASRRSEKATG